MCTCHPSDLCPPDWRMANANRGILRELINEQMVTDHQSKPTRPIGSAISGTLLLNLFPLSFFFTVVMFCFFFFKGSHNQQKKIFFLGDGQKLKDWHDQEAIRRDAQRVGMDSGIAGWQVL